MAMYKFWFSQKQKDANRALHGILPSVRQIYDRQVVVCDLPYEYTIAIPSDSKQDVPKDAVLVAEQEWDDHKIYINGIRQA